MKLIVEIRQDDWKADGDSVPRAGATIARVDIEAMPEEAWHVFREAIDYMTMPPQTAQSGRTA